MPKIVWSSPISGEGKTLSVPSPIGSIQPLALGDVFLLRLLRIIQPGRLRK